MSKSTELRTTTKLVREVLEENPKARNSDDLLYYQVCLKIDDKCVHLPFPMVFLNRKQFNYPSTETVRRARQKLQATYPELAGDSNVEGQRMVNEEAFRDYARGGV